MIQTSTPINQSVPLLSGMGLWLCLWLFTICSSKGKGCRSRSMSLQQITLSSDVSPSCVLFLQSHFWKLTSKRIYRTCISKITSSLDFCLQYLNRTSSVQDILFPPYSISYHLSFLIVLLFLQHIHTLHMWCADGVYHLRVQQTAKYSYRASNFWSFTNFSF